MHAQPLNQKWIDGQHNTQHGQHNLTSLLQDVHEQQQRHSTGGPTDAQAGRHVFTCVASQIVSMSRKWLLSSAGPYFSIMVRSSILPISWVSPFNMVVCTQHGQSQVQDVSNYQHNMKSWACSDKAAT
jgi:hypothetical protein